MIQTVLEEARQFVHNLSVRDRLYIILLFAAVIRSVFVFINFDTTVYQMWLDYFIKTGELAYYDHPPLFFIVTGLTSIVFEAAQRLNPYIYWYALLPVFYGIYRFTRDRSVYLFALLSYLFIYSAFTGFMGNAYEIASLASVVSGVAMVYVAYLLGSLRNDLTGLYAALFTAFAWWPVVYSGALLIDMFASTLIIASYYLYYRLLESPEPGRNLYLVSFITLALALYSKYYALLIGVPIVFYAVYRHWKDWEEMVKRLVPAALALLVFIPWIFYTDFYMFAHYAVDHYRFLVMPGIEAFGVFFYQSLTPLMALTALYGAYTVYRSDRDYMVYLVLPAVIGVLFHVFQALILLRSHSLINLTNYLLYSFPLFGVLAAEGWRELVEQNFTGHVITALFLATLLVPLSGQGITMEYDSSYTAPNYNLNTLGVPEFEKLGVSKTGNYTLHYSYRFQKQVRVWSTYEERVAHFRWLDKDKARVIALEPVHYRISVDPLGATYMNVTGPGTERQVDLDKNQEFYIKAREGVNTYRFKSDGSFVAIQTNCNRNPGQCETLEDEQ